jgi:DNA adenine methylase
MCEDFRNVLPKIQFRDKEDNAFIYADPPYLGTSDNYSKSFTKNDTIDLFDVLINSKVKFALSEFNNPFIRDLAKDKNLQIIEIGDRRNMATNNRKMEILVVNYESPALYSLFRNEAQSLLLV